MERRANVSRREWIRRIAAGTAALGAGIAVGCSSEKQPEQTAVTGPVIQVICHGMMAFKLPAPGVNVIEIHMPLVQDTKPGAGDHHVYKAGAAPNADNFTTSDLAQGALYKLNIQYAAGALAPTSLPSHILVTSNVFLHSVSNPNGCPVSIPASGQTPFCRIQIPIPDDYEGYVYASNTKPRTPLFKVGNGLNCSDPFGPSPAPQHPLYGLYQTPLVHVFRYRAVASATLDQTLPSQSNHWTAHGSDKLYLFAEPSIKMPEIGNSHLSKLEEYVGIDNPSSLSFTDYNLTSATGPGDADVSPSDLQPLYAYGPAADKATASPADNLSFWGY